MDRCYQLHGRPSKVANVTQYDSSSGAGDPYGNMTVSAAEYTAFMKYRESNQSSTIASANQTGNHVACISQLSSLGPWVLDSGASDHMSGNKDLLSFIIYSNTLSTVTLADGSQTKVRRI